MGSQLKDATKLCWVSRRKVCSRFIGILYFLSSVSCLVPLMCGAETKSNAAAPIKAEVEQGRLTLSAHDAPLAAVLQAIGEKAGIEIEIRGDLDARVTESLTNIPLDEGIRQLLRTHSFAIKYKPPLNAPKEQQLRGDRPTQWTDGQKKYWLNEPQRRWFLQVNSSPQQSEAERLVAALRSKGHNAYYIPARVHGGLWYRVRLGPFRTGTEARALRDVIASKDQFRDAFVGLDLPTAAQANKFQEPTPQVAPEESNSAVLQTTTPVEIAVLAARHVGLERRQETVVTPEDARETFKMIQALARRKDADAIAQLTSLAVNDARQTVRSQAVFALGRLGSQEALAPLTRALVDQSSSVRIQAMRGIKNLKGTEAVGDLYRLAANDPDPVVRRRALRFLSEIESAEVPGLLYGAVADHDATVSREASEALKIWEQRFAVRHGTAGSTR